MGKDLGTYHLMVELDDGRGWIETWETGNRYEGGTGGIHAIDAKPIPADYKNEEEVFSNMIWMSTEGNYGCDCNKLLFLARSMNLPSPPDTPCGETLITKRLTAIRPDRTKCLLLEGNWEWGEGA